MTAPGLYRALIYALLSLTVSSLASLETVASAQPERFDRASEAKEREVPACSADTEKDALCSCPILSLHPTQFSAGLIEVRHKRAKLGDFSPGELRRFLKDRPAPAVAGPNGQLYITDRHHLALALHSAAVATMYCQIVAHFGSHDENSFWSEMQKRNWVYPYQRGRGPLPYSDLPADVTAMTDDPHRSLAGAVQDAGDIDKTKTPYAEFRWADYFRPLISEAEIALDFKRAVETARQLAHEPSASGLPGYRPNKLLPQGKNPAQLD